MTLRSFSEAGLFVCNCSHLLKNFYLQSGKIVVVIPLKKGIQNLYDKLWIPASAGMTVV